MSMVSKNFQVKVEAAIIKTNGNLGSARRKLPCFLF